MGFEQQKDSIGENYETDGKAFEEQGIARPQAQEKEYMSI